MIIEMRFLNDDHKCVAQIMGPGESASEIDAFAAAFKVAAHLALRVEEPYYVPDNDDIQITMTGEDIRPKVDLGESVRVGEFGCEPDLFGKPLTNFEWSLDQKTWHHSGKRMPDVLGNIYVRHFNSEPVQIVDDLRFCDIVDRDQLNVQFDGADEMMGQKITHNWINWNGGECPVSYETVVDVWFGDGTIFYGRKAGVWVWHDMGGAENKNGLIIAYRIAKADAEAAEQKITLAGGYRTHEPFGMRAAALFRPDLTSEEIAMLEGRGDDSEVVGV